MKRFSVLCMMMYLAGGAHATTFYYDAGGNCPGWFINPNAQYCSNAITHVTTPATAANKSFGGYFLGDGTRAIDEKGNILIQPSAISGLSTTERVAHKLVASTDEIMIQESTVWNRNSSISNWYACGAPHMHMCTKGGNLYTNYQPDCWTFGSVPQGSNGTGYDYVFNSWYFPKKQHYEKGSSDAGWVEMPNDPYHEYGDESIPGGCTEEWLTLEDTFTLQNGVVIDYDRWHIAPFACKLPGVKKDNRPWVWYETKDLYDGNGDHIGKIQLNNNTPGRCDYAVVCDSDYTCPDDKTCSFSCTGTGCRDTYEDYQVFLDQSDLCTTGSTGE